MNSIFRLTFVCILCLPYLCCSQIKKASIGAVGIYRYSDSSFLTGQSLKLNSDGSYYYEIGTDLETWHSYGEWSFHEDTISLTSSIKKTDISVSVSEKYVDSIIGNMVFNLVQNLDKDIMDALYLFNGDTVHYCVPLLETGCDIKIGSVDSFQINFNNNTKTAWIKLKDKKTNLLDITVNIHDKLALYIFMENKKFLFKDGDIFPIQKDKVDEQNVNNKMINKKIVLRKI